MHFIFVSTINKDLISFDPIKNARNIENRHLSFDIVAHFDWSTALIEEDARRDYGEQRYRALSWIDGRLHVLVFTPREGKVHVISLCKANTREVHLYEQKVQTRAL